jgi:metal-sulfur cluster biosynthetic enzyme
MGQSTKRGAKRAAGSPPPTAHVHAEPERLVRSAPAAETASSGLSAELVREKLRPIEDPELGLSIVDLGLVRDVHVSTAHLQVDLTLTSPMCPWGPELVATVRAALRAIAPSREPVVSLVWEPPWDPARDPTEDARAELGIWT